MFFDSWYDLSRVAVVGTVAYAALILLLRVSGKRTLTKMNAFDLVVTVALGSTLATVLLSSEVSLAEGALALGLLVGLQYLVAWTSVRSQTISRIVKAEPRLLYHRGQVLKDTLRKERITEEELLASVREKGFNSLDDVQSVVIETAGEISVIGAGQSAAGRPMEPVSKPSSAGGHTRGGARRGRA